DHGHFGQQRKHQTLQGPPLVEVPSGLAARREPPWRGSSGIAWDAVQEVLESRICKGTSLLREKSYGYCQPPAFSESFGCFCRGSVGALLRARCRLPQ